MSNVTKYIYIYYDLISHMNTSYFWVLQDHTNNTGALNHLLLFLEGSIFLLKMIFVL